VKYTQKQEAIIVDYVKLEELCKIKNTSPTALSLSLGLAKGNTTYWKKNGNPSVDILIKIADLLDCSTDELLGRSSHEYISTQIDNLSELESEMLTYFRLLSSEEKIRQLGRLEGLTEAIRKRTAETSSEMAAEIAIKKKTA
jgi:transcriptional regulator with XRE-family HTH domain